MAIPKKIRRGAEKLIQRLESHGTFADAKSLEELTAYNGFRMPQWLIELFSEFPLAGVQIGVTITDEFDGWHNEPVMFELGDASLTNELANVIRHHPMHTTGKCLYVGNLSVGTTARFGLYDMHGNVYEWCQDVFDAEAYGKRGRLTVDPLVTSGSENRAQRGGSWNAAARLARSSCRVWDPPGRRLFDIGFRVVREAR